MFTVADIAVPMGEGRRRAAGASGALRAPRACRPDLDSCRLEDRLTPIIPNLGMIVLTTGGYMLMTPFPGAFASPAGGAMGGGMGGASGVNGTPFNVPFYILGSGGISSALPGNITGVPGLGGLGPASSSAGSTTVVALGSGADEANAPVIPLVTRNTIANDRLNPLPLIGGQPTTSSSLPPPTPASPPPAPPPPPTGGPTGAATMPPPGSSLSGPFVRFPSMFPRAIPLGFAPSASAGGATSGLSPITPPPPPGSGFGGTGSVGGP